MALIGDLVAERGQKRGLGFVEAEAGSCRNCTCMIGILLGSSASFFACLSKISREITRDAHQVGPHHLQIFDVRLKESHLVRRADFVVHKAGPRPKGCKAGPFQSGWNTALWEKSRKRRPVLCEKGEEFASVQSRHAQG